MLARNALWNYLGGVADLAGGLLLLAIVTRHVVPSELGIFVLVISVVELLLILDGGILGVLTPACIRVLREKGLNALGHFVGTILATVILGGTVLATVVAFVLSMALTNWPLSTFSGPVLLPAIAIVAFAPAAFAGAVSVRALEALQAYRSISAARAVTALVRLLLAGSAVLLGGGIIGLIAAYALAAWFRAAVLTVVLRVKLAVPMRPVTHALRDIRALWHASRHAALDGLSRHLAFGTDALVLAMFGPFAAIALLGIAQKIPHAIWTAIERFSAVTLAPLTAYHLEHRFDDLQRVFLTTCSSLFALTLPLAVLLGLGAEMLLSAWAGPPYAAAAVVMAWLLLSVLFLALSVPSITVLYATDNIHISARLALAEGVANILLSVWLAPRYGAAGVAFATALTHGVGTLFFLVPAAAAAAHVSLRSLARRIAADLTLPAVVMAALLMLMLPGFGNTAVGRSLVLLTAGAVYAALWYVKVGAKLRRTDMPALAASAHR